MKKSRISFSVPALLLLLLGSPALAQTTLTPPVIKWGTGQPNSIAPPTLLIGYDGGIPCIIGSSPTCTLLVSTSGGGGGSVVDQGSGGVDPWLFSLPANAAQETGGNLDAILAALGAPLQEGGTVGLVAGTAEIGSVNPGATTAGNPTGNATTPFATQLMISDGTNLQRLLAPFILGDGVNGNNMLSVGGWLWNGTTWDRTPGTAAGGAKVNVGQVNGVTTSTGAGAVGTGSQRIAVGQDATTIAGSAPGTAGTPSANVVSMQGVTGGTPVRSVASNPYPDGATPITASATGTIGATTATLAGTSGKTTYICGFSIRANATAAATGNATVTGTITGTMNYTQWTAPNASGVGVVEEIHTPCLPASATNTAIAAVSAAPGTGGVVSVSAWGYQL